LETQPSIFPLGLRVDEPVTAATDILVTLVCFYAYGKLNQINNSEREFLYFRLYFLFLGLATFWGGIVTHAFLYALSDPWKVPGWLMSMLSVVMLVFASISYTKTITKNFSKILRAIIVIETAAVAYVVVSTVNFQWAGYHSAFGLFVIVVPLHGWWRIRHRNRSSALILIAALVFCLSGLVFTLHLSPHVWFNHVDVTHVLLAVAAYIFYLAAKDQQTETP